MFPDGQPNENAGQQQHRGRVDEWNMIAVAVKKRHADRRQHRAAEEHQQQTQNSLDSAEIHSGSPFPA
jgi:hypothetical protein